jgi:hypothetical protein
VIANSTVKWHNTGIANFQITGCPEAINWFGASKECCPGSLPSVVKDDLIKVQALLVAECLSEGAVIHMLIVVHE